MTTVVNEYNLREGVKSLDWELTLDLCCRGIMLFRDAVE